jgi:cytochrome P450
MSSKGVNNRELLSDVYLSSEEFKHLAYEIYKELRENHPVYPLPMFGGFQGWIITRYEDVVHVLKNVQIIKDYHKLAPEDESKIAEGFDEREYILNHMLNADPPKHTRLRGIVQKAFNPKAISRLEGRIQHIANDLLNKVECKQTMNVIEDYAFPLPIIVISELIGIPKEDQHKFRKWSNAVIDSSEDPQKVTDNITLLKEFLAYLRQITAERRKQPKEDLISDLISAEENGEKLSEMELYSTLILLIVAGHETTVNLITNTVLALLQHPEQFKLLKENPALIDPTIEESLRFYSPVELATARWASEDIILHGQEIKKGDFIAVSLASANRDEKAFEHADTFDITRKNNRHLSFGSGIHFCLGAMLARLEAKIAIPTLINRFPSIQLADENIKWHGNYLMRGLEEIEISL